MRTALCGIAQRPGSTVNSNSRECPPEPGPCQPVATGFVSVDAFVTRPTGAGIRITIKEGDRVRQDVTLAPMSAIEGLVVDEFGDPAPGVVVQVAQKEPRSGCRVSSAAPPSARPE